MTISNDMSELAGFGCEAFLYGCYTILFIVSIYLMVIRSRNRNDVNRPIFFISIFLFLCCTTHFALEFSHFYTVLSTTGVKGFGNETNVLVGADLLVSIADFTGEIILIYRCWLLWSKDYWIVILPSLAAIGGLACIGESLHLLLLINPSAPIAPHAIVPLGLAGIALPLCTNVIITTLIAIRIWLLSPRKARDVRGVRFSSDTARDAINIVVESGLLYTIVQLIFVILFAIRHPAQGIVSLIAVQIYGITPTLIIIRVALGLSTTPSGRLRSGGASASVMRPTTQVCLGYSPTLYSDSGDRITGAEIPMSQMKSKALSEDHAGAPGLVVGYVGNPTSV